MPFGFVVFSWLYEILVHDFDIFIIISFWSHINTHCKSCFLKNPCPGNHHHSSSCRFQMSFVFSFTLAFVLFAWLCQILVYDFDIFIIIISFLRHIGTHCKTRCLNNLCPGNHHHSSSCRFQISFVFSFTLAFWFVSMTVSNSRLWFWHLYYYFVF